MKLKKYLRAASYLALGLLLAAIIALFYFVFSPGYMVLTVKSDSMTPTFTRGDVIVLRASRGGDIQPGQIVAFSQDDVQQGDITITHRVVAVEGEVLTTKGDAMDSTDPWKIIDSQIKGTYMFKIPLIGYIAKFLHGEGGRIFLILAGSLVLAAVGFSELFRYLRSRKGGGTASEPETAKKI